MNFSNIKHSFLITLFKKQKKKKNNSKVLFHRYLQKPQLVQTFRDSQKLSFTLEKRIVYCDRGRCKSFFDIDVSGKMVFAPKSNFRIRCSIAAVSLRGLV